MPSKKKGPPLEGKIVATYKFKNATVAVNDAYFCDKTEVELDCIRLEARMIACGIVDRAIAAGIDV